MASEINEIVIDMGGGIGGYFTLDLHSRHCSVLWIILSTVCPLLKVALAAFTGFVIWRVYFIHAES